MLQKIAAYIAENTLFSPQDSILIAVSGGRDSVTLLDVLVRLGYRLNIAHCNFQLRGEESVEDEEFVRILAQKYNIPIHIIRFDTQEYAEKKGVSIQIAARELRYAWFAELLASPKTEKCACLATAHHLNDNIETILHRWVRGTGIIGLQGIPAKNGQIVRPMLGITQEEIAEYARENNLAWREDSSNAQDKYTRNLLRHQVVPVLQKINPNFEQTFAHTLERLQGYALHFKETLQTLRKEIVQETAQATYIAFEPLLSQTAGKVFLTELLQPYQFNYEQVQLIWAKAQEKIRGALFLSPSHTLVIDREAWVITPKTIQKNTFFEVYIENTFIQTLNFTLYFDGQASSRGEADAHQVWIDTANLAYPLTLRLWQAGDFFRPLGMQGKKKKVADFLNDQKVPRNVKQGVWVLCSGEEIVWVVGFRLSHTYRITEKTQNILHIRHIQH